MYLSLLKTLIILSLFILLFFTQYCINLYIYIYIYIYILIKSIKLIYIYILISERTLINLDFIIRLYFKKYPYQ